MFSSGTAGDMIGMRTRRPREGSLFHGTMRLRIGLPSPSFVPWEESSMATLSPARRRALRHWLLKRTGLRAASESSDQSIVVVMWYERASSYARSAEKMFVKFLKSDALSSSYQASAGPSSMSSRFPTRATARCAGSASSRPGRRRGGRGTPRSGAHEL